MDIRGKTNMFVEKGTTKKGEPFVDCSVSVSRKLEDGTYIHKSLKLIFDEEKFPKERLLKLDEKTRYVIEICEGWLTLRYYKNKDGKEVREPAIFVKAFQVLEKHEIKKAEAKAEADDGLDW